MQKKCLLLLGLFLMAGARSAKGMEDYRSNELHSGHDLIGNILIEHAKRRLPYLKRAEKKRECTLKKDVFWLKYLYCEKLQKVKQKNPEDFDVSAPFPLDCQKDKAEFEEVLHEWKSKYAYDDSEHDIKLDATLKKHSHISDEGTRHYMVQMAKAFEKYTDCCESNKCDFLAKEACAPCQKENLSLKRAERYVNYMPAELLSSTGGPIVGNGWD